MQTTLPPASTLRNRRLRPSTSVRQNAEMELERTSGPIELERARGLLTGLFLGDALAYRRTDHSQWLLGSPAGQLACFTVEGMIRAWVRHARKESVIHPALSGMHSSGGALFRVCCPS